ncbi:MAG TPA: molybdopterin-dependent oxidoreductase [Paraburkholderia sp.]|uniref:molybdopterin-containing oxidoreductase family protein n=1 Tax=Paraburkholderia sp. TaxID=1926495 RepID=UPI002B46EB7F|nr:molybdopterin-dependent oxidoreductase [Paraburkholderia sp.]HKR43273.1 molybdopterin-dependent oxidoreductase [Paraburkholderia sp.]
MATHITYCRNCAAMCGLEITAEGGKLTSVRGDREHPISAGYFCVKGLASLDLHNGEDRLSQSRRRNAEGCFEPIGTKNALDEIHEKLSAIIERHGPESVALYYGTGANCNSVTHSAMKAWTHVVGTPYLYSSMTLDQSAKWVTMGRMGLFATGKHRAPEADVLMIVGCNPAVSHASFVLPAPNPMKAVRDARRGGMKLIVIDPRVTETARQADLHIQIRPGEDAAFFAGLIHVVLQEELEDASFCARFTTSLEELRHAVQDFTPDYVAARTGTTPELLQAAAEMFARARRKSAASGTGPNMGPHSNLAEHLMEALNAICGGYVQAGAVLRNVGAWFGGFATKETVIPPSRTWEHGPKCLAANIGPLGGEYPTALLPSEIKGNGVKKIRALIVVGGNLAKALGQPDISIPALKSLELLVTLDPRSTETTNLSHYHIATTLPYERYDINAVTEYMLTETFAQTTKPIVKRPDAVIDDWEFFHGLAQRMGKPLRLKRPYFGVPHRDIPGAELELDSSMTTEDIVRWMASQGAVTRYDELQSNPHGVLFKDAVAVVQAADVDDGSRLDLCPPDVAEEIEALKQEALESSDYRFRMLSRRMLEAMNSAYTQASQTRRRYPTNPVFMNADDMAALSIDEGSAVEIRSRSGRVVAYARKDPGLARGVISMSHSWGRPDLSSDPNDDAFSGRLVSLSDHLQAINFMPMQSAVLVAVRPCSQS